MFIYSCRLVVEIFIEYYLFNTFIQIVKQNKTRNRKQIYLGLTKNDDDVMFVLVKQTGN